jgi:O-antigen/teichoic acid export membrane protein
MSAAEGLLKESGLKTNAASVVCARLLVPVLNIGLVVLIGRVSGAAALGAYTLIVTLYQLCENLKSYGLTTMLVRDVAREPGMAMRYHASLVRIGYWGSIWTSAVLAIVMLRSSGASLEVVFSTLIMCAGLLPSAHVLANDALFLALNRAKLSLYISLVENLVRLSASLVALLVFHSSIVQLTAIYAITRCLAAIVGGWARNKLQLGVAIPDARLQREMLRGALPFLSVFIAPIVLFRMDIVLLGLIAGDNATGIYSAALRLVTVALIVPDGVMTAVFPVLSRLAAQADPAALRNMIDLVLRLTVAAMTALAATAYFLSPLALNLLFGRKFVAAIPVLKTLIWMPVFFTSSRVLGDALVACGKQASVGKIVIATLVVSPFLYVPLVHRFGPAGAAYALLLSAAVLLALSAGRALPLLLISPKNLLAILSPALAGSALIFAPQYGVFNWLAFAGSLLVALPALRSGTRAGILAPSLGMAS